MSAVKLAYKRLETDDEFRERLRARTGAIAMYSIEVDVDNFFGGTCKTREYRSSFVANLSGEQLDQVAWDAERMQRKLVAVYP